MTRCFKPNHLAACRTEEYGPLVRGAVESVQIKAFARMSIAQCERKDKFMEKAWTDWLADRAGRALAHYKHHIVSNVTVDPKKNSLRSSPEEVHDCMIRIIVDCMHLCDYLELSWNAITESAVQDYEENLDDIPPLTHENDDQK